MPELTYVSESKLLYFKEKLDEYFLTQDSLTRDFLVSKIGVFQGASNMANGTSGLVPAPTSDFIGSSSGEDKVSSDSVLNSPKIFKVYQNDL